MKDKKKTIQVVKNEKGFTLIEMIIVLAIIGVLAAIAIPVFSDIVGDSAQTANEATVKNIETALELYKLDNSGEEPPVTGETGKEKFDSLVKNLATNEYLDAKYKTQTIQAEGNYEFVYIDGDVRYEEKQAP